VLLYECSEEVMEGRLLRRKREDDTPDIIKRRFRSYQKDTLPVIKHYRDKGLIIEIQSDMEVEEIFEETFQVLSSSGINKGHLSF